MIVNQVENELESAKIENQELIERLNVLSRSGAKLNELKNKNNGINKDKIEMEDYVKKLKSKVDSKQNEVDSLKNELQSLTTNRDKLVQNKRLLEIRIQEQKFSPQDILNMRKEKTQLNDNYNQSVKDQEELKASIFECKSQLNTKINELKLLARKYNDLAAELELIPENARNANNKKLSIEIGNSIEKDMNFNQNLRDIREYLKQYRKKLADNTLRYNKEGGEIEEKSQKNQRDFSLLQTNVNNIEKNYNKILSDYNGEEKSLKTQLSELEQQINEMYDKIEQYESNLSTTNQDLTNKYSLLNELREELDNQQVKHENELKEFTNTVLQYLDLFAEHKSYCQVYFYIYLIVSIKIS